MLFSPDCEHCQHETEQLLKHIDEFEKIQIVMSTHLPFGMMKSFSDKNQLQRYKNIFIGQDLQFILPPFYGIHNLPFLALYDKKGKLLTTFEGSVSIEKILLAFK